MTENVAHHMLAKLLTQELKSVHGYNIKSHIDAEGVLKVTDVHLR